MTVRDSAARDAQISEVFKTLEIFCAAESRAINLLTIAFRKFTNLAARLLPKVYTRARRIGGCLPQAMILSLFQEIGSQSGFRSSICTCGSGTFSFCIPVRSPR